jgi:hypothetical protein
MYAASAATPPVYGAPAVPAAAAGGGGSGKVIAIVVALALVAGGAAFALTRGGGGGGGSVQGFCDKAKALQKDTSLDKAFNDPAKIDQVVATFDELTKAAPSEIKNDMNTINDAIKKIAAAVKSAGNDQSKQFGAILAASAQLDQKKLDQAGKNLDKFGKEKCGIDLSLSSSSSSSDFSSLSDLSSSFNDSSFSFNDSSFSSLLSSFSSDFGTDFFSTSS